MRKLLLVATALTLIGGASVRAQNPNNFVISLFAVDYFLDKNERGIGTMEVNELIVAEFPDFDQNHGIERSIPQDYAGNNLNLAIESVLDANDQPHQYTTYESDGQLILRIGNPDAYVHGTIIYKINYTLENVITFYDDHDEFFWDVNGSGWGQPISQVIAQVHLLGDLAESMQPRQACFTGVLGSQAQDCTIETRNNTANKTLIFSAGNFAPNENLSVLLGFDSGTFYHSPWPGIWRALRYIVAVGLPLGALVVMWRRWHRHGRDDKGRGTIIAQYLPPKDLNALTSDTLLNEKFRTSSLSSALIELATLGYIKIYEVKKPSSKDKSEYELELINNADALNREQWTLVHSLFGDSRPTGRRVKLSAKSHKLSATAQKLSSDVPAWLTKHGYFKADPNSVRLRHWLKAVVVGIIIFTVGAVSLSGPIMLAAPVCAFIIVIFGSIMPARTKKGVAARDHLLGLKEYIQLAEADRIKFLQSPEGIRQYGPPTKKGTQLKLFETLLPYAMLFGLEKNWAKQFEHLYTKAPEWIDSYRSFNAATFASSINGLSHSTANAFSPPAGSGSSSGSSGFGGGSSGGGGGGGGGGGW